MVSFYGAIWTLVLLHIIPAVSYEDHQCQLQLSELQGIIQPGHIIIGAVLPLHYANVSQHLSFHERPPQTTCTMFQFDYFQNLQTLIFALEEINKNPNILPNITLGFQWFDTCTVLPLNIVATLQIMTGRNAAIPNYRSLHNVPLSAFIGYAMSTHSIVMGHLLGLYRYPQISHFATSSLLSDRIKFPSFFRTVPSDAFHSQGLAQLVLHFGWTWIGLLATDNDYGQQGIQMVKQEIIKSGACVAFTEYILLGRQDRNAPHIVKTIKESTAKVVIVISSSVDLLSILEEILRQNIKGKTFIASDGWSTSTSQAIGKFSEILMGTIGLAFYNGVVPGLKEFLNKIHPDTSLGGHWVKIFWEKAFSCEFTNNKNITDSFVTPVNQCTGEENLESVQNNYNDVSNIRVAYNIYTAVHIVANALEDLRNCNKKDGSSKDIWNFSPWQLVHYMKKVRLTLSSGRELYFNENGDPPAVYDIVNWQLGAKGTIEKVKVGTYDTTASPGQVFTINSSAIVWATRVQVPRSVCSESCPLGFRKSPRRGQPVCCYECVSCPLGEISNQTDSVNCLKCPWDQWSNPQKIKCLPKTTEYLSYEDPLGATLAAAGIMSSLVTVFILRLFTQYKTTPIIKANNYALSCLLQVSLVLCFLSSLAFIGYPHPQKCLLRQVVFGLVFTLCISCILAKTIMVVSAFMATRPGSGLRKWTYPWVSYMIISICFFLQFILCVSWLSTFPPFLQYNTEDKPGLIIVECNEGSPIAFWTMLGYLFLLATISFIVAFLARRLPDSFNEAQFITFSMLAFLSVWVYFIPASLSVQGKYTVAMEIFAILASSWGLVICMFLPKCFIILFRSEKNSREYLMRRE